jgi:hypothetical protein
MTVRYRSNALPCHCSAPLQPRITAAHKQPPPVSFQSGAHLAVLALLLSCVAMPLTHAAGSCTSPVKGAPGGAGADSEPSSCSRSDWLRSASNTCGSSGGVWPLSQRRAGLVASSVTGVSTACTACCTAGLELVRGKQEVNAGDTMQSLQSVGMTLEWYPGVHSKDCVHQG